MKKSLIMGCLLSVFHLQAQSNPFLQTLLDTEGSVVVVYGKEKSSLQAAQIIEQAIRKQPGHEGWDQRVAAEEFDAQAYTQTGVHHVIAVGTLWDNVTLRGRDWLPTWWLDRDWYYSEYPFALTPEETGLPYQPTSGFFAAGYGQWPKEEAGIGLVEVDRSHYFMEWMVRTRLDRVTTEEHHKRKNYYAPKKALKKVTSPTYPADVPLRLLVRITGSGGTGVIAVAEAFAQKGLLNGVVIGEGSEADSGPEMFTLTPERYYDSLPFQPPSQMGGYVYQGWLLPSAFQYDGFAFETKIRPQKMYRLKYKPDFGITSFWTTPHRRASQFEICLLEFSTPQEASSAEKALMRSLKTRDGYKQNRITGLNHERVGSVLFIESIPEPIGDRLLQACIAAWKESK